MLHNWSIRRRPYNNRRKNLIVFKETMKHKKVRSWSWRSKITISSIELVKEKISKAKINFYDTWRDLCSRLPLMHPIIQSSFQICQIIRSTTQARSSEWMRCWWTLTKMVCWDRMDTRTFWWECHLLFCRPMINMTSRTYKMQKSLASSRRNLTFLALTRTIPFLKVSFQISPSSRSWQSPVWSTQRPPKASKECWNNQLHEMSFKIK